MVDEDARNLVRAEMDTALFTSSIRLRPGVEQPLADAKARRDLLLLRLYGLRGPNEELLIGAAMLNLMLLAQPAGATRRHGRAPTLPARLGRMARTSLACIASVSLPVSPPYS